MTNKQINQLEAELLAARKLTGHQLEKIQRLRRVIISLEARITRLTDKIEALELQRHLAPKR